MLATIRIQISLLTEFLPPIMNTALSSLLFDSSVTNKQLGDQMLGNMGVWVFRHSFYNMGSDERKPNFAFVACEQKMYRPECTFSFTGEYNT